MARIKISELPEYSGSPVGTWFVSMKINNDKVWGQIKSGKLKGFSVSGMFEQQAKFNKEEMFLYKEENKGEL